MASAVLADTTRALQGRNRGSGLAMEEPENDVESFEQLLLYADEHYLARKLPLGDHLGKVQHGVKEYHQRNVGPLRFHTSQLKWTGYHRLWPRLTDHYTSCAGSVTQNSVGGIVPLTRVPVRGYHLSPKQTGIHS
ncbi:uncharacterized protein TNCV_3039621 [Trichonephila clavipes]|uniref:Uncharacterized protein n=1 Tax=Trichonephila clavipes TaxID=2585209 RepID=A0A8X6RUS7_TRICX|nr:uncharacterized protein TNCV_3039621 [Trichonephila clavipes]